MATDSKTIPANELDRNVRRDVPTEEITEAVQRAVREAVQAHWDAGRSVPTERDGKVVWVQPDGSITDEP